MTPNAVYLRLTLDTPSTHPRLTSDLAVAPKKSGIAKKLFVQITNCQLFRKIFVSLHRLKNQNENQKPKPTAN